MKWFPILLVFFLVPLVSAGSMEDPEISDAVDDALVAQSGSDTIAAWIDDALTEGEALGFHLLTAGDSEQLPAFLLLSYRYRIDFTHVDGEGTELGRYYVHISPTRAGGPANVDTESVGCRFGVTTDGADSQSILEEVVLNATQIDPSHYYCALPAAQINGGVGSKLTQLVLHHQLVQRGPLSGSPAPGTEGDLLGVNVVYDADVAPDEGFGRDYVLPFAAPREILSTTQVLTGDDLELEANFDDFHADVTYTWEGPALDVADLDLTFRVGNGSLMVRVVDSAGNEIHEETYTAGADGSEALTAFSVPAGTWSIQVEARNLTGGLQAFLEVPVEEESTTTTSSTSTTMTSSSMSGTSSTSSSSSDEPQEKDTPAPFVGALLVVGLLAVIRRRL